jgi:DNA-binding MarR family transcriptional regulator
VTDSPSTAAARRVESASAAGDDSTAQHGDEPALDREAQEAAYRESGYELASHPAHLVRRVHQRATLCFLQVMAGESLSPTQFAALATILRMGEISQNHLGRLTAMDPSTISLVVRKLLKEKLVYRSSSDSDQRLSILRLTDKGTRYTIDRLARSVEVGERLLAPLNKAERAIFLDLLGRIADRDADAG